MALTMILFCRALGLNLEIQRIPDAAEMTISAALAKFRWVL